MLYSEPLLNGSVLPKGPLITFAYLPRELQGPELSATGKICLNLYKDNLKLFSYNPKQ